MIGTKNQNGCLFALLVALLLFKKRERDHEFSSCAPDGTIFSMLKFLRWRFRNVCCNLNMELPGVAGYKKY